MSNTLIPDGAPLLDDSVAGLVKNRASTRGDIPNMLARAVTFYQHAGRPIFHFWGGAAVNNNALYYRFLRADLLEGGGRTFRSIQNIVPAIGTVTSSEGVRISENSTDSDTGWPSSAAQYSYPEDAVGLDCLVVSRASISNGVQPHQFGPIDTNSPYLLSGCFYEDWPAAQPTATYVVDPDGFSAGKDILAAKTGSQATDDKLRDRFNHVWRYRRPSIGWSIKNVGTSFVNFTTSKNAYRYIYDQTIGDGGTAPSATGPATTLPLANSAAGRRSQVRVYVWVYACLTAGTGTGTLAVANKDSAGTMTAMTALTDNVAITGTTFGWFPSLPTFDPATNAYFNGYAGGAYDRVVLGAKSSGTASVKIGAWMMIVVPATA